MFISGLLYPSGGHWMGYQPSKKFQNIHAPPPPSKSPGIWLLENFWLNSPICWQFRLSNSPPTHNQLSQVSENCLTAFCSLQYSEYSGNDPWTWCTCWIQKEFLNPFSCNADQCFEKKSQIMPNWVGLILGQIPHCTGQNSSQIPGGISGFGIDWYIILTQNHLLFKRHDKEDDQNVQPLCFVIQSPGPGCSKQG